ncbi:MAG: polymerase PolC-type [Pseudomonadota bacterium]|jgi:DNA polymerase-3 subunit epsilon
MRVSRGWFRGLFDVPEPADNDRWVVVDVETSGLDPHRDQLLAIAAVAVHRSSAKARPVIVAADSFEAVLRPEITSSKSNILVHGIGVGAQRDGEDPLAVMTAFQSWLGRSPLFAFHAPFDETLIQRWSKRYLHHRLPNLWLDLAPLSKAAYPQVKARALDHWLAHFGIECAVRHQAAADAFATAELLVKIWSSLGADRQEIYALHQLSRRSRWLAGLD